MTHKQYMEQAKKEAQKAFLKDEVPVGAIIVYHGKIIARGHNQKEKYQNATLHAEMIAIQKASRKIGSWRLIDCDMYVTLEPCPMCAGAIIQSRIRTLYIGAMDYKAGAVGSVFNLMAYPFNHKVEVVYGIEEKDCSKLLKEFFQKLRKKNRR